MNLFVSISINVIIIVVYC